MATAIEVVSYIRSRMDVLGEVQFQKLAYYSQAWSLAWDGRPLFDEPIEAWKMGPVTPSIRRAWPEPDPRALTDEERATVDAVLEFYGIHHGAKLGELTHEELPWQEAWERRPEGSTRCSEEISRDTMRAFYSRKALSGDETPVRVPVYARPSSEEVIEASTIEAERWRETLAILAQ